MLALSIQQNTKLSACVGFLLTAGPLSEINTIYVQLFQISSNRIQFRYVISRSSDFGTKYPNIYMTVIHSRVEED